ncbi:acyl-ACP thioesterase domain-containing protein [Paenibacillus sp. Marseille-Q4541]|uniref:acyl-[acyl-carrier-protein] thioesterase n=1 Tax=Paenibacillus sp. Marseille-Q4541 TaxID=2831522 RepID=UPI001BAB030A|nr:acyl-ACP thioesterase domain-containing protein [Paenibacillus sp. Marseille-Q4541]
MNEKGIESFQVSSSQSDVESRIKLSAMLERLQDGADRHLQQLGMTISEMLRDGFGWMLMTMDLTLTQTPVLEEKVEISTWSKGYQGVVWLRDYEFIGTSGASGYARSAWTLVDIHKRKILRPSALPYEIPVVAGDITDGPPAKVSIPLEIEMRKAYEFIATYSLIDSNGHVNNARYADLCYDALSANEVSSLRMERFRITYHREVKQDEQGIVERSELVDQSIWFRGINHTGKLIFEAQIQFGT